LALKPWDFTRYTVREFEEAVAGARWRDDIAWDRLGWQTAALMNAAGSTPRSEEDELSSLRPPANVWTSTKLLGRPPLPIDPRLSPPEDEEEAPPLPDDGRPDWDAATRREKAERAKLMVAMAIAQKQIRGDEPPAPGN
jgi:hypothetical protein